MEEKLIKSKTVFDGKILEIKVDTVGLPNGKSATREVVCHPGAVSIIAIDGDDIILVLQYRHPVEEILWEVPAGKLDAGEEPINCAKRELYEETGFRADNWQHLSTFYTTPGFSDETMYLYLASGLTEEEQSLDEDEFVEVKKVSIKKALSMIKNGEIKDAKTIIGIYMGIEIVKGERTVPV